MTQEQQRIAIAEACGWLFVDNDPGYEPYFIDPNGHYIAKNLAVSRIPDYLNDLNAMHEAETVLTYEQFDEYYIQLSMRTVRPFHATAHHRAEAFLKTLNLWTP